MQLLFVPSYISKVAVVTNSSCLAQTQNELSEAVKENKTDIYWGKKTTCQSSAWVVNRKVR